MATLGTTLVQTTQGTPAATNSFVLTLNQRTQLGNAILVFAYSGHYGGASAEPVTAVSDDAGNTYTRDLVSNPVGSQDPAIYIYTCEGASSATQITVSYGGSVYKKTVIVREYINEAVGVARAENNSAGTSSGAQSVTAQPIVYPDSIAIGLAVVQAASGGSPTCTNSGTFGNFLATTITDGASTHDAVFAICDTYIYGNVGATPTFQATVGGTTLAWILSIMVLYLEGGVKAVGGAPFGMGDGGAGIFG